MTSCVRGLVAVAISAAASEVAAFFAIAMPESVQPVAEVAAQPPTAKLPAREAWRSEELLGERTEVLIWHNGEAYRLRRTRQGKLILYK